MARKKATLEYVLDVVEFIKDRMATKSDLDEVSRELKGGTANVRLELREAVSRLNQTINSKIDGVHRRIDEELDKRKLLDVRLTKLEAKVK